MFLSGEINAIKTGFHTYWAVIIAVLVALVGGSIAFTNSCIPVPINGTTCDIPACLILLLFAVVVSVLLLNYRKRTQKEVEPLETLRDEILKGLKDSNGILKRYLDAVGKSGEGNDLEKSNKEQKEDSQIPQGDIKAIKESLHEIKSILGKLERKMEEINISNHFCVFGSLFVAVGLAMIFVTILPLQKYYFALQLIAGFITFVLGVSIIVVGSRNVAKRQHK